MPETPTPQNQQGFQSLELGLLDYHRKNLRDGTYFADEDGYVTTVRTMGVTVDDKYYMIPSYVGGKILEPEEAVKNAESVGWENFPSYSTMEEFEDADRRLHTQIEDDFEDWQKSQGEKAWSPEVRAAAGELREQKRRELVQQLEEGRGKRVPGQPGYGAPFVVREQETERLQELQEQLDSLDLYEEEQYDRLSLEREKVDFEVQAQYDRIKMGQEPYTKEELEGLFEVYVRDRDVLKLNIVRENMGMPALSPEAFKPAGFGESFAEEIYWPIMGTIDQADYIIDLYERADRIERGEGLPQDEKRLLEHWATLKELEIRGRTWMGEAGAISGMSLPFMMEIVATRGVTAGAKKALTKAGFKMGDKVIARALGKVINKATKGGAENLVKHLAKKRSGALALKGLAISGDVASAEAVRSSVLGFGTGKIYADAIREVLMVDVDMDQMGEIQLYVDAPTTIGGEAILRSWAKNYVEYVSERTGAILTKGVVPGVKKGLSKITPRQIDEAVKGLKTAVVTRWMKNNPRAKLSEFGKFLAQKGGYHGVLGEDFEEWVGSGMHYGIDAATMEDAELYIPSLDEWLQRLVGFGVPMGGQVAIGAAVTPLARRSASGAIDAARTEGRLRGVRRQQEGALRQEEQPPIISELQEEVEGIGGVVEGEAVTVARIRNKDGVIVGEVAASSEKAEEVEEHIKTRLAPEEYEELEVSMIPLAEIQAELEEQAETVETEAAALAPRGDMAQTEAAEAAEALDAEIKNELDAVAETASNKFDDAHTITPTPVEEQDRGVQLISQAMGRAGIRVVPVDITAESGSPKIGGAQLPSRPDVVFVQDTSKITDPKEKRKAFVRNFLGILAHEATHTLESMNPALYNYLILRGRKETERGLRSYAGTEAGEVLDSNYMSELSEGLATAIQKLIASGRISLDPTEKNMWNQLKDWLNGWVNRTGLRGSFAMETQKFVDRLLAGENIAEIELPGQRKELERARARGLAPRAGAALPEVTEEDIAAEPDLSVRFAPAEGQPPRRIKIGRTAPSIEIPEDFSIELEADEITEGQKNFMSEFFDATFAAPSMLSVQGRVFLDPSVSGEALERFATEQTLPQDWVHIVAKAHVYTRGNNSIYLGSIATQVRGQGYGTYALKILTDLADKHGVSIEGSVDKFGKEGLSQTKLRAWYRRHGFVVGKTDTMVYKPKPEAEAAPRFAPAPAANTPEFRRWFKDSKVVDEQGNPLVVYHGGADIVGEEEYGRKAGPGFFKPSSRAALGAGIYFTPSEERARMYMQEYVAPEEDMGAAITPVYLSMQNPLVLKPGRKHPVIEAFQILGMSQDSAERKVETAEEEYGYIGTELQRMAKKQGYDGIVQYDVSGESISEYVVFEPTQVKSATGNVGTFDPAQADIRFAPAPDGRTVLSLEDFENGVEGEHGAVLDVEVSGEAFLKAPGTKVKFAPSVGPYMDTDYLYDKSWFPFYSDRMRVGTYTGLDPESGIEIKLQGGPSYPHIEGQEGVAGWAFSDVGVFNGFLAKVMATDGIGVITLYGAGNIRGNLTFLRAYFAELQWAIDSKKLLIEGKQANKKQALGLALEVLNELRVKAINHSDFSSNSEWAKLWNKKWNSLKQAEIAMRESTFETRKRIFGIGKNSKGKLIGAKIGSLTLVKQGFPDIGRMIELMEDPAYEGMVYGDMVGAVEFDKEQIEPVSAEELGIEPHESYKVVIKGRGLGHFEEHKFVLDVIGRKEGQKDIHGVRSSETKRPIIPAGTRFAPAPSTREVTWSDSEQQQFDWLGKEYYDGNSFVPLLASPYVFKRQDQTKPEQEWFDGLFTGRLGDNIDAHQNGVYRQPDGSVEIHNKDLFFGLLESYRVAEGVTPPSFADPNTGRNYAKIDSLLQQEFEGFVSPEDARFAPAPDKRTKEERQEAYRKGVRNKAELQRQIKETPSLVGMRPELQAEAVKMREEEIREARSAGKREGRAAFVASLQKSRERLKKKKANEQEQLKEEKKYLKTYVNALLKGKPKSAVAKQRLLGKINEAKTITALNNMIDKVLEVHTEALWKDAVTTADSALAQVNRGKDNVGTNEERAELEKLIANVQEARGKRRTFKAEDKDRYEAERDQIEATEKLEEAVDALRSKYAELREQKVNIEGMKKETVNTLAEAVITEINIGRDPIKQRERLGKTKIDKKGGKKTRVIDWIINGHSDMSSLIQRIVGSVSRDKLMYRLFVDGFRKTENKYNDRLRDFLFDLDRFAVGAGYRDMQDMAIRLHGTHGSGMLDMLLDQEGNVARVELGKDKDGNTAFTELTMGEALHIYLLDPSTFVDVINGAPLSLGRETGMNDFSDVTIDQIAEIVDMIPDNIKKLGDNWKKYLNEEVRPGMFAAHMRLKGYEPEAVEGYWPRQRLIKEQADQKIEQFLDGQSSFAGPMSSFLENSGQTKRRIQGSVQPVVINSALTTFMEAADTGMRISEMAEQVRVADGVMRKSGVREALEDRWGPNVRKQIRQHILDSTGVRDLISNNTADKLANYIASNTATSLLAMNPRTWAVQISGIPRMFGTYFNAKEMTAGIAWMTANSGRLRSKLKDKSSFFWRRWARSSAERFGPEKVGQLVPLDTAGFVTGVVDTAQNLLSGSLKSAAKSWGTTMDSIKFLDGFDAIVCAVAYGAALSKAKSENKNASGSRIEEIAAEIASNAIRDTQNSTSSLDLSGWSVSAKQGWARYFIMFSSDPIKLLNVIAQSKREFFTGSKLKGSQMLAGVITSMLSAPVLRLGAYWGTGELIAALFGDDDDVKRGERMDELETRFYQSLFRELSGLTFFAPILDIAGGYITDEKRSAELFANPLSSLVDITLTRTTKLVESLAALGDDEADQVYETIIESSIKFANDLFAVGAGNPLRPIINDIMKYGPLKVNEPASHLRSIEKLYRQMIKDGRFDEMTEKQKKNFLLAVKFNKRTANYTREMSRYKKAMDLAKKRGKEKAYQDLLKEWTRLRDGRTRLAQIALGQIKDE